MEKHKCKVCLKKFANGRALGGHMRSHMLPLYVNPSPPLSSPESETGSSKNPTRRRSKRARKPETSWFNEVQHFNQSVSNTSPEEDVAFCLMMLSRDKWADDEPADQPESESDHQEFTNSNRIRARMNYECETCNKVFNSYQALGGHRANHKKYKVVHKLAQNVSSNKDKVHICPVCFKVFSSGQALGGHKRTHGTTVVKHRNMFIDLNLPAPTDDDDDEVDQIEVSTVSDGEFVKAH
uniref:zinc finger protein ZAT9-like n=1 Tax=Erigeron canadensis TaxID=72917 RepID=UPI001CB8D99F|nr:zinc finger protein ZAT9-like [Erigeron canadensis]